MKLSALLNACKPISVGIAGLAVIGGSAATIINTTHTSEVIPNVVATEEVQVPILELKEEATETKEEKTAPEVAAANPSTQPTTTAPKTDPVTPKVEQKKETVVSQPKTYNSIIDFERAYKGVCPKDVPAGVWPQKMNPAATLGYTLDDYQGAMDIKMSSVRIWNNIRWEEYPQGRVGIKVVFAYEFGLYPKGDDGVDNLSLVFEVSWSDSAWTVDWRRAVEDSVYKGKYGIGSNATKLMDNTASQLTQYFNSYEDQFRHCRY